MRLSYGNTEFHAFMTCQSSGYCACRNDIGRRTACPNRSLSICGEADVRRVCDQIAGILCPDTQQVMYRNNGSNEFRKTAGRSGFEFVFEITDEE